MRSRLAGAVLAAALATTVLPVTPAAAELPYGQGRPPGTAPTDYADYLFIGDGDCDGPADELPETFDCVADWKLSDDRADEDPDQGVLLTDPQEFFGVKGPGLNQGWEVTTGRPDVVIAVLDSGIRWEEDRPDLLYKHHLNWRELPPPPGATPDASAPFGGYDVRGDTDHDGVVEEQPDGVFNVVDYWGDPNVTEPGAEPGTYVDVFEDDDNDVLDPGDLIRAYSDGVDDDANGYVDDISGWDFFEDDNNPQDDTDYGHGTGEMEGSAGEAGLSSEGTCPNCMAMSLRVGDSFIADVNHFAEAVVYAVDNGAMVVQEALGTLNHTSYGQEAVDHAYANGVIVNASEADEAAGHHNWPAAYDHTMVVNSIRLASDIEGFAANNPRSYLYLNGCTNFGGYTYVAIPSTSCSSDATGLSSGYSGLLQSAALNAVDRGELRPYPAFEGSSYVERGFPLSTEEAYQLWRLAADDVDLASPCVEGASDADDQPVHAFCDEMPPYTDTPFQPRAAAPDDYGVVGPVPTTRYQTVKGWDFFTGYGRSNVARLVRYLGTDGAEYVPDEDGFAPFGVGTSPLTAEDRVPPEADITTPRWWRQYAYHVVDGAPVLLQPDDAGAPGQIVVEGRVAANRVTRDGGTYDYVVEWAPHVQGLSTSQLPAAGAFEPAPGSEEDSHGPWFEAARVEGRTAPMTGELGRIDVADVVAAQGEAPNPFLAVSAPPFPEDPTSRFQPERFGIRLRVRVVAHPTNPDDTVNNEAVRQKQVDVYEAPEAVIRDDLGLEGRVTGGAGSPSFHDVDGDGRDELLLATSDGVVHAYTDVARGTELPGWPVRTDPYPGTRHATGDNAYTRGEIRTSVHGAVLAGTPAVADLDDDGEVEVLVADLEGRLYAWAPDGSRRWTAGVDRARSVEPPCGPDTIPACDDFAPVDRRDRFNNKDHGFNSAPSTGDLDPTTPGLEVVVGSGDGHIYAFHADGSPVEGWPVLLRDPDEIEAVNEVGMWSYPEGSGASIGGKVLVTPSLADLDGDGDLEVVVGANEAYAETPNLDQSQDPALGALGALVEAGNTRLYALHHTGEATAQTDATGATAHPHDQAYVDGWPVPIADLVLELLPYVGIGTNSQSPVVDVDGDGTMEVAVTSIAGPGFVLDHDGTSFLGAGPDGGYRFLATSADRRGATSDAGDFSSVIGVGALVAGSMDGGGHVTIGGPGAGVRRLLDVVLEGDQFGAEDHLGLWNATTGDYEPNAPVIVNDLQFFTPPILADVTGDGNAEMIQGTAVNDTVVVGLDDPNSETATRYHTGGWHVGAAAVGDAPLGAGDDGRLHLASVTREGYLRLWPTEVDAGTSAGCTSLSEWPEYGHDPFNSGTHGTDAVRPYPVGDLAAEIHGDTVTLTFTGTGDDRHCGAPAGYEVRVQRGPGEPDWSTADPLTAAEATGGAGTAETITADGVRGARTLLVRARDDAGNGSAVAAVQLGPSGPPGGTPPLPATGGGAAVLAALLLVGGALAGRRWRHPVG